MQAPDFSPGDVSEQPTLSFSFVNDLAAGETISSVVFLLSVAATSVGADGSPSSRLIGSPAISGLVVSQRLSGCLAGVIYLVEARVTTSLSNVYSLWNHYAVGTPA
jgi:hypothetical protein